MKTPKRINDLLEIRSQYLNAISDKLDRQIVAYQQKFLDKIYSDIIPLIETDAQGNIIENLNNMRLLQSIEKVMKDFTNNNKYKLGGSIAKSVDKVSSLGNSYFLESLGVELPAIFPQVIKNTKKILDLRLGIKGGKIVAGEFLDKLITDDDLMMQIKEYLSKAITGRVPRKDFIKNLTTLVTGGGEKMGAYQRRFSQYAHDLYMQYDAAYNKTLAQRLGMHYFIYQGNLIGDSRDFCVAKTGKVYNGEDALEWYSWTPAKGITNNEFPPMVNGKPFKMKQKNINAVPSYLSYDGYSPLIDRGGYNCRHRLAWISDRLAERMTGNKPAQPQETTAERTQRVLAEKEEQIRFNNYETAIIIDPNSGDVIYEVKGGVSSAPVDISKVKDNILTHNHPSSRSFSLADLRLTVAYDGREMRATSRQYLHQFIRPEEGWGFTETDLLAEWDVTEQRLLAKYTPKVINGELTELEANMLHYQENMELLSKKLGFLYKRTKL